jgi:hypothetical protein
MRTAFMQILWGLVIVAVDVTFQGIDLWMPDIVGYALVYAASTRLAGVDAQFGKARPYAVVATVVWIVSMTRIVPEPIIGIAAVLSDLALAWFICTGILRLAVERSNLDLAHTAGTRRTWLVSMTLVNVCAGVVAQTAPELVRPFVIPLVIMSLTVAVSVLLLLKRASVEIV